ncbi:MAG TPA: hypothetical protein VNS52_11495 [Gemmatimonadaceae bacterium]|nr:hypothetical protein [Gemmatimonadaceae bacterium]
MPAFFPHVPHDLKLEEPAAFRRLSFSLVEMATVTGVVLRLLRALAHGATGWVWALAWSALVLVLLLMSTAHLANFTVRQWAWRAPAFGAIEAAAAMLTSVVLIAIGREPLGTARATWHDWPRMALQTLGSSLLLVSVWALLLAAVVVVVRRVLARRVWREHAASHPHGQPPAGS